MSIVVEKSGDRAVVEGNIRICARCSIRYDWRRSPSSSLKMTYCGSLCETAGLGFTIEGMLKAEVSSKPVV